MEKETYLFVANALVWIGVGGYLLFLSRAQARLKKRLERLETPRDHDA
ncbi:CcmD family protein [Desulfolutivibrio sulfoxidireducens]|nr:CcmD family protein [Desulfolutivibrio sulfoxidireducens]QLA15593.1 CcmD family protein [Desulfolutivibrio sulfoxidireducens]QLA19196.1 CcmD family protein [Desulfolutivibrio sulfoxidireducens]